MSDFNYQEYLKNNPLLQEEVKDQLITESQEIERAKLKLEKLYEKMSGGKKKEVVKEDPSDEDMDHQDALDKASAEGSTEFMEEDIEENARTDAEEEGYKDGFEDAKDDIEGALKKMKVSELKAKIKEDIISLLQEDEVEYETPLEEEEEIEVDIEDEIEDEVEVDVEEPSMDTADAGLSQDEQDIQDSLKLAYDNAVAIGDQKLADQIGNSITFFTRTHVVER